MALVKWRQKDLNDPWNVRNLQKEINDLFNFDFYPATTGLFDRNVSPVLDVVEGAKEFEITCELPGVESKDIDVSISSNILTIKGEKKDSNEEKSGKFFKKQTWYGKFQRTLSLPHTIDSLGIKADLKDGVLKVIVPKKEEAQTKTITVKVK